MQKTHEAIHSPPDTREIRCRYLGLQKQMKHLDLDYYGVFNPVNVYYLTNFANKVNERPIILLVPQDGSPFMLVPMFEKSHVERRTLLELSIIEYPEFPAPTGKNWHDLFKNHLHPNLNIGIESSFPIEIVNHTPGNKVICNLVDDLRIIKTDYEISRNIHACEIINRAHKELLKRSRAGLRLGELIPVEN